MHRFHYCPAQGSNRPTEDCRVTKRRAIYIEVYNGADGQQRMGVDIVTLRPPTSWRTEYFGEDNDEICEYHLKSLGEDKTRIDMRFRNKWKGSMSLSTREKQKIESDVWDRYVATLEKDFLGEVR